mmetsp:Transcript_21324/g.35695  ORF Transcript_21324/g.35695 Transcript_21324/m.35695 type:complete len:107 (+) Transcript_21324:145-465(+)
MAEYWGRDVPNESTRLLSQNVRISKETEMIAESTVEDIERQGEQLDETQYKVGAIKDIAEEARSSARTLKFKVYGQQAKLWTCIVCIALIDICLIVRMWYNNGSIL